jgi:hypothetical protein
MASVWKAVDPTKRYRASEVLTGLQGYAGRSLTPEEMNSAYGVLGRTVGENDEITGDEYNKLLQTGAGMTPGAAFEPWATPPAGPPEDTRTGMKWAWDEIPDAPGFKGPDTFSYGDFDAPDKFTYGDFQVPGAEGMYADQGYQFRLEQGRKAVEASKAAQGKFLSGETLRDLMTYGQGMASQEYGNVFNRATDTYKLNRGNAEDIWNKGYDMDKDVYTTNRANASDMWDKEFDLETARYAPEMATWSTRVQAGIGREGMNFDREWQKEVYRNDDQFRRMVFGSDDEFRRAVQKEAEAWKRELMIEERLKFLSSGGRI